MADLFNDLLSLLTGIVGTNQLLLVFLVSVLGNSIPFFPLPYLIVVITLANTPQFANIGVVQVAAIAALGASMGKFVSYGLGYGVRGAMSGSRARFDSLRKLLGGSAFLVAFLFAASPFPDDIVFIPLGIMKYSPIKTFISLFSGKFTLTVVIVYAARRSEGFIQYFLGGGLLGSIVGFGLVIAISLLMMRVDWEKFLVQGRRGLLRRMLQGIKRKLRLGKPSDEPSAPEAG